MTLPTTKSAPYLRLQRQFPSDDIHSMSIEMNRAWIDLALKVNARTIGTYSQGNPSATGNTYYYSGKSLPSQSQLYLYTGSATIAHGISVSTATKFVRIYGTLTDGTNWYPLPYVDVTDVTKSMTVNVDSTNINVTLGASAPSVTSGYVVLEWISVT
ncbi:MAG: hypothetical protein KGI50_05285 [Patescibacteria group bacterium]|nr:hypothetical protein [Patescibacteria group bacterium]MDE2438727.1 hypothetical protein [Patescibacteria group bacterium]